MQQLQDQVNQVQVKIEENNKVKGELQEPYNRFKDAEQKLLSSFAAVRKLNTLIKELETVKESANKLSEEVSMINQKTDKKSNSKTGSKTYELVIKYTNTNNGTTETLINKVNGQQFSTLCGYGTATLSGSNVKVSLTTTSSHALCNGHKAGWTTCAVSDSKEISNAQKTTCNSFCNTYASRYGW